MSEVLLGKYELGKIVYTSRPIRFWSDKNPKDIIPKGTPCKILSIYAQSEPMLSSISYNVEFAEYGRYVVAHVDLKLK